MKSVYNQPLALKLAFMATMGSEFIDDGREFVGGAGFIILIDGWGIR